MKCCACKKEYPEDDVDNIFENQEFLLIEFTGGYGSVFGDMSNVTGAICQHCLKKKFGDDLTVDNTYWDNLYSSDDPTLSDENKA